jgi:3-methylcrotonyl-CoA carboxylase alpha subunit
LPSPGRVDRLLFDYRARVESGVEEGDAVSNFYDPMIAKVICHSDDREAARTDLVRWLDSSFVGPVRTNKAFLHACLSIPAFAEGVLDTGLIEREETKLTKVNEPSARVLKSAGRRFRRDWLDDTDWDSRDFKNGVFGFRLNAASRMTVGLYADGNRYDVDASSEDTTTGLCSDRERDGTIVVTEAGQSYFFSTTPDAAKGAASAADGAIIAPMPGKVIAVDVSEGQAVTAGQRLMVLEAMKMEHALTAPFDGVIEGLSVSAGAQVQVEAVLVTVVPASEE